MASMTPRGQDVVDHVPNEVTDIPNTHLEPPLPIHSTPVSSTPLEMSRLEPRPRSPSPEKPRDMAVEAEVQNSQSESMNPAPSSSVLSALGPATSSAHEPPTLSSTDNARPTSPTGVPLTAQATNPAIGPSSDQPTPMPKETDLIGPTLVLTLLLPTGARHPYRMDEKYLKKRNVHVANNNPIHMSVYTLKELIWREWREEWELRPSSPSAIRLIHFGKLLDDKTSLEDAKFKNDTPNVVHMTVKPQDIVDEEDAKLAKQGGRDRDGNERSPGCRCVLM